MGRRDLGQAEREGADTRVEVGDPRGPGRLPGHEIGQNRLLLRYSREGAEVAREMGVPVIDSNDVIRDYKGNKADLFAPTGAHWSALGAELLAKFIDEQALKAMVKPNQ